MTSPKKANTAINTTNPSITASANSVTSATTDSLKLLKEHHITITELRIEMIEILAKSSKPLSVEDFPLEANKTTFYRNMELFEKANIVIKSEIERKFFYELAQHAKAHFVCDVCHQITDVKMPKVKGRIKSVVIKGVCESCEEKT